MMWLLATLSHVSVDDHILILGDDGVHFIITN